MTETQRRSLRAYVLAALLLGIGFWSLDALLDFLFFYSGRGTFLDLLVLDVPSHEIYIRLTFLGGMLIGAVLLSGLTRRIAHTSKALRTAEQKLAAALENSLDTVSVTSLSDGKLVEVNRQFTEMFGYQAHEVLGRSTIELGLWDDPRDRITLQEKFEQHGSTHLDEVKMRRRDNSPFYASITVTLMEADSGPQLLTIVRDITARREENRRLEAALHQNEIMLREIHHRVKNNMQIVSSLLSLQGQSGASPDEIFRETQGRIRTMALVHEELYRSDDMSCIDFHDYARSLAERVLHAYAGRSLDFHVAMEQLRLPLDKAVPLGLVLNELLTNAVRHGYPQGGRGTVRMASRTENGDIVLEVADDGVGLPEGFAPGTGGGLGTQIVQGLMEQIKGRLEYAQTPQGGTRAIITLPMGGEAP